MNLQAFPQCGLALADESRLHPWPLPVYLVRRLQAEGYPSGHFRKGGYRRSIQGLEYSQAFELDDNDKQR